MSQNRLIGKRVACLFSLLGDAYNEVQRLPACTERSLRMAPVKLATRLGHARSVQDTGWKFVLLD